MTVKELISELNAVEPDDLPVIVRISRVSSLEYMEARLEMISLNRAVGKSTILPTKEQRCFLTLEAYIEDAD